ncbi:MAG: ABC transporter substrate-binding protein [Eubacteriales bacterium]|nr:ABC transporter substrate-binding protein [Eubacteriales bacterium]
MKKTVSLLLAMLMAMAVLTACQPSANKPEGTTPPESAAPVETAQPAAPAEGEKEGGTVILRETGDPKSFCPSLAADDNAYAMMQNMFNRLTKLDSTKSPIPDAASSWDVSDDALTITFHLKDNMHWWDGEQLDATDVKYTFDYIKEHSTCYFSSAMGIVDSIEVVDPLTVVFHMNTADMSFVARIGWYGTFIVPEHIFNNGQLWEDNEASKTKPVGSGPFMFESYKQGESTTLVRNPNYHDGAPKLEKLVFAIIPDDTTAIQALLNGEVDSISMVPDAFLAQLQADPNFRCDLNIYPSPWRFIFNTKADTVKDLAVRKAIALCLDREDISQKVTGGIMPPEYSAYPSVVAWCSNTTDVYPKCNIDEARATLEAAGYKADAEGYYIRGLTLDAFEGQLVDMSKLLIANCAKAGIEIELIVSEFNAWSEKVKPGGDWMIEAQGGFMGPDPAALYSRYGSGQNSNYAGYENPEFDALCIQGAAESDQAARAELYRQAQALLIRDLPALNVLGWANYEASRADLVNLPIDGAGKWGWQEYTFTYYNK